jgi:hypothetical protein
MPILKAVRRRTASRTVKEVALGTILDSRDLYLASTPFRQQCVIACELLTPEPLDAPFLEIAHLWSVTSGTVSYHVKKFIRHGIHPGTNGRPPTFTLEAHQYLVDLILDPSQLVRPLSSVETQQRLADRSSRVKKCQKVEKVSKIKTHFLSKVIAKSAHNSADIRVNEK